MQPALDYIDLLVCINARITDRSDRTHNGRIVVDPSGADGFREEITAYGGGAISRVVQDVQGEPQSHEPVGSFTSLGLQLIL